MDFASLKLAYSGRRAPFEGNALVLEQKEWSPYDGSITNTSMVNSIANFLYSSHASQSSEPISGEIGSNPTVYEGASLGSSNSNFSGTNPTGVECSLDADGCMVAIVFAYPIPWDLPYVARTTHGSVGNRIETVQEFRELIQVRLQDPSTPISPDYPIKNLRGYEWFGDVYDNTGRVIPGPRIRVEDETEIYVDGRVFGTIDVTYTVEKHIHLVTIQPDYSRPEEDKYKSVFYAPFEGGVEWEEIEPAPSANFDISSCGWFNVRFPDDDELPTVDGNDKIEEWEYCSGALLERKYI